jgi:FkbM family methyltransferase
MNFIEKYNLNLTGAITIGADEGQEIPFYKENKIKQLAFFEPRPSAYEKLLESLKDIDSSFHVQAFNVGLGDTEEVLPMHTAGGGQSSSFLKPKLHLVKHPSIVFRDDMIYSFPVKTLDSYNFSPEYNYINMDVQGYELRVLKGGARTLNNILALNTEVNIIELYENCVLMDELDNFLTKLNFSRVETNITEFGWGDALYIKNL